MIEAKLPQVATLWQEQRAPAAIESLICAVKQLQLLSSIIPGLSRPTFIGYLRQRVVLR